MAENNSNKKTLSEMKAAMVPAYNNSSLTSYRHCSSRYAAISARRHLWKKGHDLPLGDALQLSRAGYVSTLGQAWKKLRPYLEAGNSPTEAVAKLLAMELPDKQ